MQKGKQREHLCYLALDLGNMIGVKSEEVSRESVSPCPGEDCKAEAGTCPDVGALLTELMSAADQACGGCLVSTC